MSTFEPVRDVDELEGAFEASRGGPVLLFLYDPHCPINWSAEKELDSLGVAVYRIDVSRDRTLNPEVARRTGVRHESPQLFVLKDGAATWHASHGRIRAQAVAGVLAEASSPAED